MCKWPWSVPMNLDDLERLEEVTLSMVVQAIIDYKDRAVTIFKEETDKAQDIAEDVTREALDEMHIPKINLRLYGKADVKKAIYVFLPKAIPVALMLDTKTEKSDENTATIQMSQTSMCVRMKHADRILNEQGKLETVIKREKKTLQTVTIIVKYLYTEQVLGYRLNKIIVACIPNGQLQEKYSPDAEHTIWRTGRNAPTLGEDFRVRVKFNELKKHADWRVHDIPIQ